MPLVAVAHFIDLPEAQVAASALHASGIDAVVQNEVVGQSFYHLQRAFGGFRILVPEEDAADARAFVAAGRSEPRPPPEPGVPPPRTRTAIGMFLALFLG